VLLDDSRRYVKRAIAAGVDAKAGRMDGNASRVRQWRWKPAGRPLGTALWEHF
jgi:hypothetical protein